MNRDMHYLQLLSASFPTIAAAATEIINLEAILNLPKGTEHFLADLHGESQAFQHVRKNASGNIRRKVSELFKGDIREAERRWQTSGAARAASVSSAWSPSTDSD